jgi:hypothetical protein
MDDIHHPVIKASVGIGSWVSLAWLDWLPTAGKYAAAVLSIVLLSEWLWKKAIKPFAKHMGWIRTPEDYWYD